VAPPSTTAPSSHSGQLLSRAVTFQFALDPNLEQRVLLAKCAGARRYTVNYHLARVKANLEARSSERDDLTDEGTPRQPSTPSLSWTAFSFINEFNAWKRQSMTRWSTKTGPGAFPGATNCPATSSSARAWTRPGPARTSLASRRGERSGTPAGFPASRPRARWRRGSGCATARRRAEHHQPAHSLQRSFTSPAYPSSAAEALRSHAQGPSHDRRRSLPRLLSHPHPTCRTLDRLAHGVAAELHQASAVELIATPSPSSRPRDHLPLRRRDADRCFHRELRG